VCKVTKSKPNFIMKVYKWYGWWIKCREFRLHNLLRMNCKFKKKDDRYGKLVLLCKEVRFLLLNVAF